MKQIIINSEELQTRVAVVHDGVLHDFFLERNAKDRMVGSIYKGRIKNLEPSLQAAFVDIGFGKNAFLHYWDMIPATQDALEGEEGEDEEDDADIMEGAQALPPEEPQPARQQGMNANGGAGESGGQGQHFRGGRSSSGRHHGHRHGGRGGRPQGVPQDGGKEKPAEKKPGFFSRLLSFFSSPKKTPVVEREAVPVQETPPRNRQGQGRNANRRNGGEQPPKGTGTASAANKDGEAKKAARHGGNPSRKSLPGVEDIPNLFHVDQEILVQVTKGPIGTKGARVTTNLSIPGRYLVLLPSSTHNGISRRVEERGERTRLRNMMRELKLPQNMGVICRTVGAGRKLEHFQRDLDLLMEYWNKGQEKASQKRAPVCVYQEPPLAERALRDCLTEDIDEIITDSQEVFQRANELLARYNMQGQVKVKLYDNPTPIFTRYGLTSQMDGIFNRKVMLPSGGYLCIDETEALIAIDVNTGKNRTGKDQPETILATNLEAVHEIARQLRLRNVGGLVVLDLIDMRQKKDQMTVYKTLKDLMNEDHAKTKVYPISPLGLLEMTRQRENESLESAVFDDCPYCKGRGLIKSPVSMSVEIQRKLNEVVGRESHRKLVVRVHPRVLERLKGADRKLFAAIEKQYSTEISFEENSMMHVEDFQLLDGVSGQKIG